MKNNFLPRIVAASFLLQILMTWKLWFPVGRTFPLVPLLLGGSVGEVFALLTGIFLAIGWAVLLFFPKPKLARPLLFCLAFACIFDLTRLQVWVWFYALVLLIWVAETDLPKLKNRLLWLCAAVYFWGGLNKLNPYFQEDIFSWWCESSPFLKFLAGEKWAAVAAALVEMSLAAGIIFQKSRRVFGWLAIAFHLFNVLMLSPLALNWNLVVVPWNLAMVVLIWWICLRDDAELPTTSSRFKTSTTFVLLLAWLAPALNFAGWFPHNLSWKMYSGTHPEATFFYPKNVQPDLPPRVRDKIFGETENRLTLDDWANEELGVPPFSTEFALKKAGRMLCKKYASAADSTGIFLLTIQSVWKKDAEIIEKLSCEDLARN